MIAAALGGATELPTLGLATLGMYYFGFVHFAVGYHFFARSDATRALARRAPVATILGLGACVLVALPFYTVTRAPLAYTVVFVHFAENALYLAAKRDGRLATDGAG